MAMFTFPVKSFKKFEDPFDKKVPRVKYRFFVETCDVPEGLLDWMNTNPREQNLSTDVSRDIETSLKGKNQSFHLWNRGILFSADKIRYDNKSELVEITLTDENIHGNIDGGHTLRIICDYNKRVARRQEAYQQQYVEFEVLTGLDSTVLLAEARNTSTQVDTTSIEELKDSFQCIKDIISTQSIRGNCYFDRISFKQNQYYGSDKRKDSIIDVRELIAILNMFSPILYPKSSGHPLQSYTGKETSLRKFLNMGLLKTEPESKRKSLREEEIKKMSPIIPDIFALWDEIETEFPNVTKQINKRYGRKAYSGYREDDDKKPMIIGYSMFSCSPLNYLVPKGLMYPLVGAFRALVVYNDKSKEYEWIENPFSVWDKLKDKLVESILNSSLEQNDNPNAVGKSLSAWDGVYTKVYIYSLEKQVNG